MEDRHRLGLVLIVCGTILMLTACGTLLFRAYLRQQATLSKMGLSADDALIGATTITVIPGVVMVVLGVVLGIWRSR